MCFGRGESDQVRGVVLCVPVIGLRRLLSSSCVEGLFVDRGYEVVVVVRLQYCCGRISGDERVVEARVCGEAEAQSNVCREKYSLRIIQVSCSMSSM